MSAAYRPLEAEYQYGVMHRDGSVSRHWNGRTQEQRARAEVARCQVEYPRDNIRLVRRLIGPWEQIDVNAETDRYGNTGPCPDPRCTGMIRQDGTCTSGTCETAEPPAPASERLAKVTADLTRPRLHGWCGETHAPGHCADGILRPPANANADCPYRNDHQDPPHPGAVCACGYVANATAPSTDPAQEGPA